MPKGIVHHKVPVDADGDDRHYRHVCRCVVQYAVKMIQNAPPNLHLPVRYTRKMNCHLNTHKNVSHSKVEDVDVGCISPDPFVPLVRQQDKGVFDKNDNGTRQKEDTDQPITNVGYILLYFRYICGKIVMIHHCRVWGLGMWQFQSLQQRPVNVQKELDPRR